MPCPLDARVPVNAADRAYGKVASPDSLWRPHPRGRNQGVRLSGLAVMAVVRVVDPPTHAQLLGVVRGSAEPASRYRPLPLHQYVAGSAACGRQQEHQDRRCEP